MNRLEPIFIEYKDKLWSWFRGFIREKWEEDWRRDFEGAYEEAIELSKNESIRMGTMGARPMSIVASLIWFSFKNKGLTRVFYHEVFADFFETSPATLKRWTTKIRIILGLSKQGFHRSVKGDKDG